MSGSRSTRTGAGGRRRVRRGLTGTAAAVTAMAALTASQAPGLPAFAAAPAPAQQAARVRPAPAGQPADDAYRTELPPLAAPAPLPLTPPGQARPAVRPAVLSGPPPTTAAGVPATVLLAYRRAEAAVARTDPGCRLPWQLLAAIGKVESGQANGGRVDARGTTLTRILGPVLNGAGFARITDTDGGRYDGDAVFDRAVGPMQFIPSTWAAWGADGNGDGRRDPDNIHDAALAAGRYLCAGDRDLSIAPHLSAAVLSYNRSDAYLRTVLSWLAFYRGGVHAVPDDTSSHGRTDPGTASGTEAGTRPAPGHTPGGRPSGEPAPEPGGGIVVGPQPTPTPPAPTPSETSPAPTPTAPEASP
ncbi:lytic transglycosylase domain-containing protein [Streptomyces sp. ODS05-4]|uniref:lytic transglycosylase domain-containing protein n=1 Tax=Streptomyces sp. ODS05-4 TaxID=2944939 RepID=UPI0027E495C4|nr:lytic transglycosylase domain-containing protein [Streptomyces sp. ODS05-4]